MLETAYKIFLIHSQLNLSFSCSTFCPEQGDLGAMENDYKKLTHTHTDEKPCKFPANLLLIFITWLLVFKHKLVTL